MAITLVDLTGDVADLIGGDYDSAQVRVWIDTNIGGPLFDEANNVVRMGATKAVVNANGTFVFTGLVATDSDDVNPSGFQYQLWVEYFPVFSGKAKQEPFGWFSLTATSDLSDVVAEQYVPPTWMSSAIAELQGYVDAAAAAAEAFPTGGTTGQVLTKVSGTDYDTGWSTNGVGDVTMTGVQTLTNKDLSSGTNTFPTPLANIVGLSPSNDDVIQRKAGSWVNRTMTQLKVDLAITVASISDFVSSVASAISTERTAVATYTNKDLSSGTNTFPTFNQNTSGSAAALTTSRTIGTLTGDVTTAGSSFNGSANNTNVTVLATVNSNVGSFGSATQVTTLTVNAKGLVTAAGSTTIAIPASAVTDFSTAADARVAAAAATGTGSLVRATSPTLVTPALGTPTALTLTNATGLPASGIGSGTVATARLGSGTAGAANFLSGDQTYKTVPGQVLGFKQYGAATSYLADSTTLTDVDATNLAVAFNAPSSGNVLVRLTGYVSTESDMFFGVRESSSAVVAKRLMAINVDSNFAAVVSAEFVVTGLTPAAAHTYKWAFASSGEASLSTAVADDAPAAVMTVVALP